MIAENKNNENSYHLSNGNIKSGKNENVSIVDLSNSSQHFNEEDIKNAATLIIQV